MKPLKISLIAMVLTGCSTVLPVEEKPDDPRFSPVPAQSLTPPPSTGGSLYQANYSLSLYSDQRAKRIGDVIQTHDQLGDVCVHHLGMGVHILERGIFDVDIRLGGANLGPCRFDPRS